MLNNETFRMLLDKSPEKIVDYFRNKGLKTSFNWEEVWQQAHYKAFTVAKAVKLDILKDIHNAVTESIAKGETLTEFKKKLEPSLKRKGWWGIVKAKDMPGFEKLKGVDPEKVVKLGTPYRLKNIYRTNLSVAYSAGKYNSMMENMSNKPYWKYVATLDSNTRPSHFALHGKVFTADNPIWDKIYPPNDWGCRCRVEALSKNELKEQKLPVEKDYNESINFIPEEWRYNPAKGIWDLNGGLDEVKTALSSKKIIKAVKSNKTWKDFNRPDIRKVPEKYFADSPGIVKPGKNKEEAFKILLNELEITDKQTLREVDTPVGKVLLNKDTLHHIIEKRQDMREQYAKYIIPTLKEPFEVYLTLYEDSYRHKFIKIFKGKNNLVAVVRINKDGSLLWNIMQADNKSVNKQRIGELIFSQKIENPE